MIRRFRTIDAHVAGAPLRLVVEGLPFPEGASMRDKQAWLEKKAGRWRKALLLEPRGHRDMSGVLLTEAVTPGFDAGILFLHPSGYSPLCGHGLIGAVSLAVERGILPCPASGELRLDTVAGPTPVRVERASSGGRGAKSAVTRVSFEGPPAFVLHAGLPVKVLGRSLRLDIAYGGEFFAIVDAEAVGLAVDRGRLDELRRAGIAVAAAANAAVKAVHPLDAGIAGIEGAIFMAPPRGDGADLRNVTVFADGGVDRSPCGTGTFATMAVLHAMGMLTAGARFVAESIIDTRFDARVVREADVGGVRGVVAELGAEAWVTGEHEFVVDDRDPLKAGFSM